jgi:hypothetical protein
LLCPSCGVLTSNNIPHGIMPGETKWPIRDKPIQSCAVKIQEIFYWSVLHITGKLNTNEHLADMTTYVTMIYVCVSPKQ